MLRENWQCQGLVTLDRNTLHGAGGMQAPKSYGLSFGNGPVGRSRGYQELCKCKPVLSYSENRGDPCLDTSLCIVSHRLSPKEWSD